MRVKIIGNNSDWLIDLLQQYFSDIEFCDDEADVVVSDQKLEIEIVNSLGSKWLIHKPIKILKLATIMQQALDTVINQVILIGPIKFYPQKRLCLISEEKILLTQKETEILLYLISHNKEVEKSDLLHSIWGYSNDISTHTLETHIYKLRNKFMKKYDIIKSSAKGYSITEFHI